jgi:hypothetical protein
MSTTSTLEDHHGNTVESRSTSGGIGSHSVVVGAGAGLEGKVSRTSDLGSLRGNVGRKLTRLRVIGFDTNSKEYRLFSFAAGRKASEALGRWDDTTGVVNWRMAQEPKGVTSTATWRFADDGSVDWHVTRKSKDKTLMELMIRLERQKTRQ